MTERKLRAVGTPDRPRAPNRDWRKASEIALVAYLEKASELAPGCGDTKQCGELLKIIGEIVGTGTVLGVPGKRQTTSTTTKREDEDDEEEQE